MSAPSRRPATSHHPLDDARLKVDAAHQNFDALKATIEAYASSRPYSVGVAYDAPKRQHLIHVPAPPALPREWSILVGQLGTNARAALDYLVHELSVYGHGDPDKDRTQFPISESRDDYLKCGKRGVTYRDRSLAGVDERFRQRIDDLQPYHRRKNAHRHWLALLAKLTNRDKHRTIVRAHVEIETASHIFRAPTRGLTSDWHLRLGPAISEVEFTAKFEGERRPESGLQIQPKPEVHPHMNQRPATRIAFSVGHEWLSLYDLRQIVSRVRGIVDWAVFEEAFEV